LVKDLLDSDRQNEFLHQTEEIIEPGFSFGMIGSLIAEKITGNDLQTADDYNLVLADPNFAVLRMIFNFTEENSVKTLKKIFLLENIATNFKIYHLPDVMGKILIADPNWPDNSR
jgi:hypothetical protein